MYKIFFGGKTNKEILKLSKVDKKRVAEKLQKLNYPFPYNLDISKISGEGDYFRLRVGDIRIIFLIDHKTEEIIIRKIAYRGSVYKY